MFRRTFLRQVERGPLKQFPYLGSDHRPFEGPWHGSWERPRNDNTGVLVANMMMQGNYLGGKPPGPGEEPVYNNAYNRLEKPQPYEERVQRIIRSYLRIMEAKGLVVGAIQEAPIYEKHSGIIHAILEEHGDQYAFYFSDMGVLTIFRKDYLERNPMIPMEAMKTRLAQNYESRQKLGERIQGYRFGDHMFINLHLPHGASSRAFEALVSEIKYRIGKNIQVRSLPTFQMTIAGDFNLDPEFKSEKLQVLKSELRAEYPHHDFKISIHSSPEGHMRSAGGNITVDAVIQIVVCQLDNLFT